MQLSREHTACSLIRHLLTSPCMTIALVQYCDMDIGNILSAMIVPALIYSGCHDTCSRACDKRLARLISNIHNTGDYRQH